MSLGNLMGLEGVKPWWLTQAVGYLSTAYKNLQVTVFRVSICTSKKCLTCP